MPYQPESISRAEFLRRAGGLLAVGLFVPRARGPLPHPEPRPGITAEHVLATDALGSSPKATVIHAYDAARAYPQLFDGVACACSCGGKKGMHRSLLVCYETMQPTGCPACRDEGLLIERLAKNGKSLDEIRKAIDEEYG
jgi:hypothetical protein